MGVVDSDSDEEDSRPWKSQTEIRIRVCFPLRQCNENLILSQSGSVPNGAAAIPPYRAFQRVFEYLIDQLDLSDKRKDIVNALPHEEKWKLLSNISRESSLNLLVFHFFKLSLNSEAFD